ncbi:MAG: NAD(P)H-dependent oxidoreductase subunit E [Candidatus Omnitrophica bacterium]|nr:NAD(P)H-dependent oxidoreductase subunit E [Candidatus Omnitrophota bacterium]
MDLPFELKAGTEALPVKAIVEKPVRPDALLKLIRTYIVQTGESHRRVVQQIQTLVERWRDKPGNLVMILHEIQNHYGYVPRGISFELSRLLGIPLARIYEVITFYNFFKLDEPGKYVISVCMGTACYLKGAPQVLEELKKVLSVGEGQTTADGLFHLQVVRCLGCCGLAPVITVNEKVFPKVRKNQVMDIVSQFVKKEHAQNEKEA